MKNTAISAMLLCLLLAGCDQQAELKNLGNQVSAKVSALAGALPMPESLKDIEDQVRAEVVRESAGLASLQAIYIIDYMNIKENWVRSDDAFIQKDKVDIDYGFQIDESAIRVVKEGSRKILQVRLKKGRALATNRVTLGIETTHKDYRPKENGQYIDVDAVMTKEIESVKAKYGEQHLMAAADNIKNIFKVIAAKYGLELDFQVES